jgi:hypothetical protein
MADGRVRADDDHLGSMTTAELRAEPKSYGVVFHDDAS